MRKREKIECVGGGGELNKEDNCGGNNEKI